MKSWRSAENIARNAVTLPLSKRTGMKSRFSPYWFIFLSLFFFQNCNPGGPHPVVLVFSKTEGYRHASIEAGIQAIRKLGAAHGFRVEATEDATYFTEEKLGGYAAVVFLNTSGDVLDNWQQADFQRFIEAGGGYVGIHGASATEYDWHWYGKLVGAYFDHHPAIQEATLRVVDKGHPATELLPDTWKRQDEWYNFRPVPPSGKVLADVPRSFGQPAEKDSLAKLVNNIVPASAWTYLPNEPFLPTGAHILLALDETTYQGGTHGPMHPIAWCQEYEGGRSFYTGLGHTVESYQDSLFLLHLLGGMKYAIGNGTLDYSRSKTHRLPKQDRFVRTILATDLDEPTEMALFPGGKVLFIERKGAVKLYDPETDTVETICIFPVYHENEEGMMGLQADPDWEKNKWVYIFYSVYDGPKRPVYVADGSYHLDRYNRLSRFVFDGKMLHLSTEKVLLTVPELIGCCHTGGSIDFDSRGNLFLSTGDNTNPFESDGFGPIDQRPGRSLWDAQKSSANTNDLRGKILRITPLPDGTYSIPEGNLFAPGTPGTRPEIYVMGCRNPYRIAVDKKTDCLYWGDVGPDAGKDGPQRGSKGYDTWNRACEAGNHGWPHFRGNHIYYKYDFATKKSGPLFDPLQPLNVSPFNTGLRELPPLQTPLIWYSYDESFEFPWLGTGGKNPMAGPVFHASDFGEATNAFPAYFENKLFIYEWMRHWIYVVTLDEEGRFVQADPFLPDESFSRPMDMAFGPDGALYLLEYGEQWFSSNPDARLSKIEYAPGNRKPIARMDAEPLAGATPLKVQFSAASSVDYDGDPLQFEWILKNGALRANGPSFEHTFNVPGNYTVELRVKDPHGAVSRARTEIAAGNAPPVVQWQIEGNQTFYWDEGEIAYRLDVSDAEDGSLQTGTLDPRRVKISIDYLAEGKDIAAITVGHQTKESASGSLQFAGGQLLIENNDCKTCHDTDRRINGPSYIDIANRYYGSEFAVSQLTEKVIKGGAGNWGETAMSAHPDLTEAEAQQIVRYILSMAGEVQAGAPLPYQGKYLPKAHLNREEKGAYIFQASYRDLGRNGAGEGSLYAKQTFLLRYPKLDAGSYDMAAKGIRRAKSPNSSSTVVTGIVNGRHIGFKAIDLTGVGSILLGFEKETELPPGTALEIRTGSPAGKLVGQLDVSGKFTEIEVKLSGTEGKNDVYVVFKNNSQPDRELGRLEWLWFKRAAG